MSKKISKERKISKLISAANYLAMSKLTSNEQTNKQWANKLAMTKLTSNEQIKLSMSKLTNNEQIN